MGSSVNWQVCRRSLTREHYSSECLAPLIILIVISRRRYSAGNGGLMKTSLFLAVLFAYMTCAFSPAYAASDHLTKRCGLVCQAKCAAKRAACLDACVSNPVPNPSQCVTNCTDQWRKCTN